METNNTANIARMNVNQVIEQLATSFITLIRNNQPIQTMPSVMLWGAPGVGKSQAIRQLGKEIANATGKTVNIQDVRLLLFNPIDLRGIPTKDEKPGEEPLAKWLKPEIFQMDTSDNVINILFLDEISAAPASVQAAAYQITLDRRIGEHQLPDNCIVIAAGNRVTDKSVAYKMPKALANRLLHIDVKVNFDSWKDWAIKKGINPKVIGFLSFRQEFLMRFNPSSEDLAYPTPRSWEMVSNILNHINNDITKMFPLIEGLIGVGPAMELKTWDKVYRTLPKVEDIFDGLNPPLPNSPDALYALISSIVCYAREHKDDLYRITNAICYIANSKMPPDYAMVVVGDFISIEKDYQLKLMNIPEFVRLLQMKGKKLNGSKK